MLVTDVGPGCLILRHFVNDSAQPSDLLEAGTDDDRKPIQFLSGSCTKFFFE